MRPFEQKYAEYGVVAKFYIPLSITFLPMARQLRLESEGALYHVTSRGNARRAFYVDNTESTGERGRRIIQEQQELIAICKDRR